VYRCNSSGQRWNRIKSSVRFNKETEGSAQLFFEHGVDASDDKIFFAFTYPYSYTTLQNELSAITHENDFTRPDSLFYQRELLTLSRDGRRVELLTISSVEGHSSTEKEPLLSGLFPDSPSAADNRRPPVFPNKEIMFISARVHPGEVPAQHTFKGILSLLLDPVDLTARELRARYVFKLIPMLNPDGESLREITF
jgi:murein tripeptide amidase MpaA